MLLDTLFIAHPVPASAGAAKTKRPGASIETIAASKKAGTATGRTNIRNRDAGGWSNPSSAGSVARVVEHPSQPPSRCRLCRRVRASPFVRMPGTKLRPTRIRHGDNGSRSATMTAALVRTTIPTSVNSRMVCPVISISPRFAVAAFPPACDNLATLRHVISYLRDLLTPCGVTPLESPRLDLMQREHACNRAVTPREVASVPIPATTYTIQSAPLGPTPHPASSNVRSSFKPLSAPGSRIIAPSLVQAGGVPPGNNCTARWSTRRETMVNNGVRCGKRS